VVAVAAEVVMGQKMVEGKKKNVMTALQSRKDALRKENIKNVIWSVLIAKTRKMKTLQP
jgi:hypothetical protein